MEDAKTSGQMMMMTERHTNTAPDTMVTDHQAPTAPVRHRGTSMSGRGLRTTIFMTVLATTVLISGCGTDDDGSTAPSTSTTDTTVVESTVPRESVTHDFVVPAGTADRIARDEEVEVVPDVLEVHVGDRIRVRNDDRELARLGIFDVGAGETISMNFNTPGELQGLIYADASGGCGVPPPDAQTFTIIVLP